MNSCSAQQSVDTDFTLFDGRSHVLGATVLHTVGRLARELMPAGPTDSLIVVRGKFTKRTQNNGVITLMPFGIGMAENDDSAAFIVGEIGDRRFFADFVPDGSKRIERTASSGHKISSIDPNKPFSGSCRVQINSAEEFPRILVDANKLVQLHGEPLSGKRWVSELAYIENLRLPADFTPYATDLDIQNLANREAGGRIFSLNLVTFRDVDGAEQSVRIALSFHPKSGD